MMPHTVHTLQSSMIRLERFLLMFVAGLFLAFVAACAFASIEPRIGERAAGHVSYPNSPRGVPCGSSGCEQRYAFHRG
jgi:Mn2+/Fe2+ NRAMP family transporter